jgi:NTE family protein
MNLLHLAGGGANGAFQAGKIDAWNDEGIRFGAVAGISVGALNGIMVACGLFDQLRGIWNNLTEDKVLKKRSKIRLGGSYVLHKIGIHQPPMGLYANSPLKSLVKFYIEGCVTIMPFYAGAVNIQTGRYVDFHIPEGTKFTRDNIDMYTDWIVASTAIPGIFDPVKIDGQLYVDGGVRNQTPLKTGIAEHKPEKIWIVTNSLKNDTFNSRPRDIIDILQNTVKVMTDEQFSVDLGFFAQINHNVKEAGKGNIPLTHRRTGRYLYDFDYELVVPAHSLGDALDFSTEKARRLYRLGYEHKDSNKPAFA